MKPPIIVYSDGTTDIFKTVEHAESYLEVPDIENVNDNDMFFDRNGTILTPTIVEVLREYKSFLFFRTKLRVKAIKFEEGTEKNPERLKKLLKRSIESEEEEGLEHNNRNDDLETLLARAIDLHGYTR
ncbi:MAG: hypothetical protein HQL81_13110 [Magnetococcales bacterium]|nr:hypothetical protein [Magnetococcales bacterium]